LLPISSKIDSEWFDRVLPKRFIVIFGPQDDNVGLLVTTPGSVGIDLLEWTIEADTASISSSLTHLLVGILDVAGGVSLEQPSEREYNIQISNPQLNHSPALIYRWLGTPLTSIAASLLSEAIDKPVIIVDERQNKRHLSIKLGVL
jgi:hypothetical protein